MRTPWWRSRVIGHLSVVFVFGATIRWFSISITSASEGRQQGQKPYLRRTVKHHNPKKIFWIQTNMKFVQRKNQKVEPWKHLLVFYKSLVSKFHGVRLQNEPHDPLSSPVLNASRFTKSRPNGLTPNTICWIDRHGQFIKQSRLYRCSP